MTRKERYKFILDYFENTLPDVSTELKFGSVFQQLVATILSAQCTDKRINEVTPALFARYPDAKTMATADEADILAYIKSVSYPNSKAKHLVDMSRMLVDKFNGEVPSDFDALVSLPGVGRKTANVTRAVSFGFPSMAVDTHVYRVSHRLGLVSASANTPAKVEKELLANIPAKLVSRAHHWLLLHGRYVCKSIKPNCAGCVFVGICPKLMKDSKLQ